MNTSIFGNVVNDWQVERIRNRVSGIVGGEWGDDPETSDEGVEIPVIRVADICGTDISTDNLTIRRIKESKLPDRLVNKRTILLEKSGGGEGSPVGRAVCSRYIEFNAICSNFMAKFDCNATAEPSFMIYVLDALYSSGVNVSCIQQTTGIQNLRVTDYLNSKISFPSKTEQMLIAAYLDASCAAIDGAVAAKQQQLSNIANIRQELLHTTFQNEQWPTERIKDVSSKIGSGMTPEGGAVGYLDVGIPLLRSQNIHFEGIQMEDVAYIDASTHQDMSNSQLQPHDVLLNITGASIGRCTFVPDGFGEGNVNQHVCIIRPIQKICHKYLATYLSSPKGQGKIFSSFTGASRQGLSHKEVGLITIPFPSLDIQHQAIAVLETKMRALIALTSNIQRQVLQLMAYRKSLIHECVTGKRRVTEADVRAAGIRAQG